MAYVTILIGAHLCTAPRPQKEAEALAQAGHQVTVRGCWFMPELIARDCNLTKGRNWKFAPFLDFRPHFKLKNSLVRLQKRVAKEKFQRLGLASPALFGYGTQAMLRAALKDRADLTIVHSEAGLWVGQQLLRRGWRVGVDFEDWFSEDLPPEARNHRPLKALSALEKQLLQQCSYTLTTSTALAHALATAYQAPKPLVIRNTFPLAERQQIDGRILDRQDVTLPSLHWFSQTIGPGRGLEDFFAALPLVKSKVEIHLRGSCDAATKEWIMNSVPQHLRDLVFIHPTVPNEELLSRIAEHDIGLALEVPICQSRQLTITNKLFQYLQAGLAIIATDTAGQKEVLGSNSAVGSLVRCGAPAEIAAAIDRLAREPQLLAQKKAASLRAFQEKFHWEAEVPALLAAARTALA